MTVVRPEKSSFPRTLHVLVAAPAMMVSLLLATPQPAVAQAEMRGLDTQEARLEWTIRHVEGKPEEEETRACLVYARYAVLTTTLGIMAGVDMEFRVRPRGMPPKELCAATFRGPSAKCRQPWAGLPKGVFEPYVLCVHPEQYGSIGRFLLFDMRTGVKVYEDFYFLGLGQGGVTIERATAGPVLSYWAGLIKTDCVPRCGETTCWAGIRKKFGVPSNVPQPDCEGKVEGETEASDIRIAVHVRVSGLSRLDATYLPDRPKCLRVP